MKKIFIIIVSIFLFSNLSIGTQISSTNLVYSSKNHAIGYYANSHALLIGIENYQSNWQKIPNVKNQIEELDQVLQKKGFQTQKLINPTYHDLKFFLNSFISIYGQEKKNRLLIYYFGNTYQRNNQDYLVPIDAPSSRSSKILTKVISLKVLLKKINQSLNKHSIVFFEQPTPLYSLQRKNLPQNEISISFQSNQIIRQYFINQSKYPILGKTLIQLLTKPSHFSSDRHITGSEIGVFFSQQKTPILYKVFPNVSYSRGDFIFPLQEKIASFKLLNQGITPPKKPNLVPLSLVNLSHSRSIQTLKRPTNFQSNFTQKKVKPNVTPYQAWLKICYTQETYILEEFIQKYPNSFVLKRAKNRLRYLERKIRLKQQVHQKRIQKTKKFAQQLAQQKRKRELEEQTQQQNKKQSKQKATYWYNRAKKTSNRSLKIQYFTKALGFNSKHEDSYYYRGRAYNKQKKYTHAILDLTRAIQIDRTDAYNYYERGLSNQGLKRWNRMCSDLTTAIRYKNRFEDAYYYRGICYHNRKLYSLAKKDFTKAIQIDSRDPYNYFRRGKLYQILGKHRLAIQDFNQTVRFKKNHKEAYYYRGKSYHHEQQYQQAINSFSRAIQLNRRNANNYQARAESYLAINKKNRAIQDYQQSVRYSKSYQDRTKIRKIIKGLKNTRESTARSSRENTTRSSRENTTRNTTGDGW
ncbi:MAG: tetratricopeptide (TPR) repeat protein [bacterium]|jgi:tetratricopeptide (TPR) repeat protein